MGSISDAPIYAERFREDRELMARYWSEQHYGGKSNPKALAEIRRDMESLDEHALAYLRRDALRAIGPKSITQVMPDTWDPWQSAS